MSFASRFFGLATAKVQLSDKPTRAFPIFFCNLFEIASVQTAFVADSDGSS